MRVRLNSIVVDDQDNGIDTCGNYVMMFEIEKT
jgi:hypothetical protein